MKDGKLSEQTIDIKAQKKKQKETLRAAIRAQNKNPYVKAKNKAIQQENDKILKTMGEIHAGKTISVTRHTAKAGEYKSLNFTRAKHIAQSIDQKNEKILKVINTVKTGVPDKGTLKKEWS